ncbi:hypothetical protein DFH07DRAFT_518115 [Mycena maculata]|uniref:Uncharacterized protein n=1 Tax=Mycena maculata TaxID=230809 RepID=A0AAD7IZN2_9AGAR|nr:hypothetical protein DFH07DRAFT_518115 [Mycena maculata]
MSSLANANFPAGYTYAFCRPRFFVSVKVHEVARNLLGKAQTRGTYGKLSLIDSSLATLHSKILKKEWNEAFTILSALTLFNEVEDDWPMLDDGKRVALTNKVYGASLVTVLRALKKEGRLDILNFPALETTLREAAGWGGLMKDISCNSDYDLVCKAVGARLFQKSEADIASEKARQDAWLASRSQEDQDEFHRMMREEAEDEEDEDEGDESEPWHSGGSEFDEDVKSKDFDLSRVWKEYKAYLDLIPGRR